MKVNDITQIITLQFSKHYCTVFDTGHDTVSMYLFLFVLILAVFIDQIIISIFHLVLFLEGWKLMGFSKSITA